MFRVGEVGRTSTRNIDNRLSVLYDVTFKNSNIQSYIGTIWPCHSSVNPRLSTAEDQVRSQVSSCVICGGQSDASVSYLRLLLFPLPPIPLIILRVSSSIIRRWYNRPEEVDLSRALSHTPPPPQELKEDFVDNCSRESDLSRTGLCV
jgi:hypothetical protein